MPYSNNTDDLLGKSLSPRETEFLDYLYTDKNIRQIALKMEMTYGSAKNSARYIYAKLGINGRVALMAERITELETGR